MDDDEDNINNAKEELKRADHLYYVSLKYSRTSDVIRSIVERLISAFDFSFAAILEKKKMRDVSEAPVARAEVLRSEFQSDEAMSDFLDFYLLLRKIIRSPYTSNLEFRRHVTVTTTIPGIGDIELNVDIMHDYYMNTRRFVDYVERMVK